MVAGFQNDHWPAGALALQVEHTPPPIWICFAKVPCASPGVDAADKTNDISCAEILLSAQAVMTASKMEMAVTPAR
jgi:hypothetical protein